MLSELDCNPLELRNSYSSSSFLTELSQSKLFSLKNKAEWSEYLSKLPDSVQDIYYSPEYYDLWEKNYDGKAFCFVFEDGNHLALYPFLLNRINDLGYKLQESYYDIQGAYGYNGVVYSSNDFDFRKRFYSSFNKFCKSNNIIAEFTRFNPILGNNKFSENFYDVIYDRQTVNIDLSKKYDYIYKDYSRSAKQNLRTAVVAGLNNIVYKNVFPYKKEFIKIYRETMDRVQAERYLYFNDDFFNDTFNISTLIQFVVFKDNIPVASSLCFGEEDYLHVHFLASKSDYLSIRPNNFLFDIMIKYGIGMGFKKLHLGGGTTSSQNDYLLRFKKNFSKATSDFYIGKKIYNEEVYSNILLQWGEKYPNLVNKHSNKILRYRYFS